MSAKVYRDAILEPEVRLWLERGDDFILEEDNDSGHGGKASKKNEAWIWKQQHGVKCFNNCPQSPDIAYPIKQCWQPLKARFNRRPYWDEIKTKQRI